MVIVLTDHVKHCYSNGDGEVIFNLIKQKLDNGEKAEISFSGIDSVSSSFVNSALIELLDHYSFDYIKENLIILDSTRHINEMIHRRFSFEVNERHRLVNV